MNINEINFNEINRLINCSRLFLNSLEFTEINLYCASEYEISNIDQVRTSINKILRSTTEPDIWIKGNNANRFYCITSLFRIENPESRYHKDEFKIVDFYIRCDNYSGILSVFVDFLKNIEEAFCYPPLSSLEIEEITYNDFNNKNFVAEKPRLLNVIDYPIEESFFDEINPLTGKTYKGELYYVDKTTSLEFCVYGRVGDNKNPEIKLQNNDVHVDIYSTLNLYGLCFGVERLLAAYKLISDRHR